MRAVLVEICRKGRVNARYCALSPRFAQITPPHLRRVFRRVEACRSVLGVDGKDGCMISAACR